MVIFEEPRQSDISCTVTCTIGSVIFPVLKLSSILQIHLSSVLDKKRRNGLRGKGGCGGDRCTRLEETK